MKLPIQKVAKLLGVHEEFLWEIDPSDPAELFDLVPDFFAELKDGRRPTLIEAPDPTS